MGDGDRRAQWINQREVAAAATTSITESTRGVPSGT